MDCPSRREGRDFRRKSPTRENRAACRAGPTQTTMPTARYHTLLCRDAAGGYSAIALDDGTTGFGDSANAARDDLREFLRWSHRKDAWRSAPDFTEPELRWFSIVVRPEYKG